MKNKVLRDPTTGRVGLEPKNLAQWSGWARAKGKKPMGFMTWPEPDPIRRMIRSNQALEAQRTIHHVFIGLYSAPLQ